MGVILLINRFKLALNWFLSFPSHLLPVVWPLPWGRKIYGFQSNFIFGFSAGPDMCESVRHGTTLVHQDGASGSFHTPFFTQPNNIWPLPCRPGFWPRRGDSQHQNPEAPFTIPFSNPWATSFPCNKTSKQGTEAKGVALTQAGPSPSLAPQSQVGPSLPRWNTHQTVLGAAPASWAWSGARSKKVGLVGRGKGSAGDTTMFYDTTLSAWKRRAMRVVWRGETDRVRALWVMLTGVLLSKWGRGSGMWLKRQ